MIKQPQLIYPQLIKKGIYRNIFIIFVLCLLHMYVKPSNSKPFFVLNSDTNISVDKDSLVMLASLCDGDARSALNGLEMAFQSKVNALKDETLSADQTDSGHAITVNDIKESFQRSHVSYDKNGEEHFNIISALHKSVRAGDENAALYWLGRMLVGGEEPLYIARRLVRMASEDIG